MKRFHFIPIRAIRKLKDTNQIRQVYVSVAFYQDPYLNKGFGRLYFVCPFCHAINWYSTGKCLKFGSANGPRLPHCSCKKAENTSGKLLSSIFSRLASGWCFHIKEVEDPSLVGDLPAKIRQHLTSRKKR